MPRTLTTRTTTTKTKTCPYPGTSSKPGPSAVTRSSGDEYLFNFGKHTGKTLAQVPASYISWCIKEDIAKSRPDLANALKAFKPNPRARGNTGTTTSRPRATTSNTVGGGNTLLSLEDRTNRVKNALPQWLWQECWEAAQSKGNYSSEATFMMIDINSYMRRAKVEQIGFMEEIIKEKFQNSYPPRPDASEALPSDSPATTRLRGLLALSPEVRYSDYGCEPDGVGRYAYLSEDGFTGEMWWEWMPQYQKDIQGAVDEVKKAHGDSGYRLALWEVRDCVSALLVKCLRGCSFKFVN